jgi:hypothetical protein
MADAGKTLEENGVIRCSPDDLVNHIGKFLIVWRKKRKMFARIESVDTKEKRLIYEVASGPDKGDRIKSRYDTSQTVYVCTEEQMMLGLLFTQS